MHLGQNQSRILRVRRSVGGNTFLDNEDKEVSEVEQLDMKKSNKKTNKSNKRKLIGT